MNSSSGGFIEIFLGDVPPMYRDNRLRPFRLSRLACACGNSLVHDVSFGFVLGAGSSDVLQFLGIDTHPLPDTPFHISPFLTDALHASTHGLHALLLSIAQIIEQAHLTVPLSVRLRFIASRKDWMPNIYSGKLLARVAAIAQS